MQIDISAISLDVNNFRHKVVSTEREAITVLLSDEKTHKIAELAQDIVEMGGLDPSSLLIVMDDPNNPNQYIALEGNRRLTALKTLITPSLAVNLSTHNTFRDLSSKFMALNIVKVDCVVLDRPKAFEWIKRKHYNSMGGRGTIEWNAIATAKADAAEGRPPRWMVALSAIEKNGTNTDILLDGIASKTTTVERVLGTAQLGPILGITFDIKSNSVIAENGDNAAAVILLSTMLSDMADKSFKVTEVEDADAQTRFIKRYAHLAVKKTRSQNATSANNSVSSAASNPNNGVSGAGSHNNGGTSNNVGGAQNGTGSGGGTARAKPVRVRKYLADKGLKINNIALNKLYNELRKLNAENNAHISSAMIRIFIEKATMVFLEDMAVSCPNTKGWQEYTIKLKEKVSAALHVVDPHKKNAELKYARDIANGTTIHLHSLEQLNRAIHDHKALPATSELILIWDRLHPYLQQLFQTLEVNGK